MDPPIALCEELWIMKVSLIFIWARDSKGLAKGDTT